jgi:iron complex outermembrane receptor protein
MNVLRSKVGKFYALDQRGILSISPCLPETGPETSLCRNLEGNDQTYAPNFTFNANASYTFDIGPGTTLTPRINFGHIGAQWATLFQDRTRGDRIPQRNIVNAQLALTRGDLTVTAYSTNLTDRHYPAALNSGLYFAGAPRQYGIKVQKTF